MKNRELKKAGLKTTQPRTRILQLLESNADRHLSAEDVYRCLLESGEDVGLATVYRVLTQFEAAGLVTRHYFEGGKLAVFELDQGVHHDHLMCLKCGKIFEFSDDLIEERQQVIAEKLGFDIAGHALYLYGKCRKENCENKDS
jgi:Fur family ferric uptake transcriptional regulator